VSRSLRANRGAMKASNFAKNLLIAALASGIGVFTASAVHAFPWSTDMYRGPQIATLAVAPRSMPDGVMPVDGIHYNVHYGQPASVAKTAAPPPMKLEMMTVKMQNPLTATPDNLAKGKQIFETTCSPCHGITGQGNGTVVHLLQHKPANLLTGVSKNLPDGYIYGYIRNGGIWMPAYDDAMSSNERWQVVLYVRDLERKYGNQATASAAAPASTSSEQIEHRHVTDTQTGYSETGSDSP
jgi:mono/diheme cytochrome c family protein